MKPFDIVSWQAPGWPEPHPAVVISHPDRAGRKPDVEVILCSTKRAARPAEPHEFILDQADGLDWPTICKCDLIYAVPRAVLEQGKRRGSVSPNRRGPLLRKVIAAHGWAEVL
jgi:hypothetical protein